MYVPMLQSLQAHLANEICLSEVVSYHFAKQNFYMRVQ